MELQSPTNPCGDFFDPDVAETLRVLVDTLIPPDDYPGGWDGGVGNYLAHGFTSHLAHVLPIYRAALIALDAEASDGAHFATLSDAARIGLLERLEINDTIVTWPLPPAEFLTMANQHAAEGFYADPSNGGNINDISWKMIGFEVSG